MLFSSNWSYFVVETTVKLTEKLTSTSSLRADCITVSITNVIFANDTSRGSKKWSLTCSYSHSFFTFCHWIKKVAKSNPVVITWPLWCPGQTGHQCYTSNIYSKHFPFYFNSYKCHIFYSSRYIWNCIKCPDFTVESNPLLFFS